MKILFCEGSSLSAREALTALGPQKHSIIICDPDPKCLCRFTKFKVKYYRCPSINQDLEGYYRRIVEIIQLEKVDVLLPVHEQALLFAKRLPELSKIVRIDLPEFNSYLKLFSKIRFIQLLDKLKLPHPRTILCDNPEAVHSQIFYPCFLKAEFGTASSSVWQIENEADLGGALEGAPSSNAAGASRYLIQEYASGRLEVAHALFNRGKLISFHCCRRIREGARGSSSSKIGVERPALREHFKLIGRELGWHGPLALDYFYDETDQKPYYIDASPRLVEPMNTRINGINQPEQLLLLSRKKVGAIPAGATKGLQSHMLMMSLLDTAGSGKRLDLIRDLMAALQSKGVYFGSAEELTNPAFDWRSLIPLGVVILRLLIDPKKAEQIAGAAVHNYALSHETIARILAL